MVLENKRIKILIVDDEPGIRDYLSQALTYINENDQMRIVQATDGMDALAKIKNEDFDLVITDLIMPRLGGLELITYINTRIDIKSRPQVMAISASITQELLNQLIELGQKEILIKPFDQKEFLQKVIQKIKPKLKTNL